MTARPGRRPARCCDVRKMDTRCGRFPGFRTQVANVRRFGTGIRHSVRVDVVDLGTFARAWAVQKSRVAWLLGAGTSAGAGVPTAARIVDDLITRLYADAFGMVRQVLDTTNPAVMDRIRDYYDDKHGMPSRGSAADYSTALELAMPDPDVRAQYLRERVGNPAPSFGQRVLGAAVAAGAADLLITTNFDELLERAVTDAHAHHSGGHARLLTVAALESPGRAQAALANDVWPLLIKLHGDFRESELKNLSSELQSQDAALRQVVIDASRRVGLAVAGYSGRDDSVMAMLHDALAIPRAWPAGIWWLSRDPTTVAENVLELLERADQAGVAAHLVEVANFDEAMGALANQVSFDPRIRAYVDGLRPAQLRGEAPLPTRDRAPFPVLRMNALPLHDAPRTVLRLPTPAGTSGELLRELLSKVGWRGAAVLGPDEVLALGSAASLASAFAGTGGSSTPPEVMPIDLLRSDQPPHHRALLAEALTRALCRRLPTKPMIRDGRYRLRIVPVSSDGPDYLREIATVLRSAYDTPLTGELPVTTFGANPAGTARCLAEGLRLHFETRLDATWMIFVPYTWVEQSAASEEARRENRPPPPDPAGPWIAERWARRRKNETWAGLIDAWATALSPDRPTTTVHALRRADAAVPDAMGGRFVLGHTTAYSREMG